MSLAVHLHTPSTTRLIAGTKQVGTIPTTLTPAKANVILIQNDPVNQVDILVGDSAVQSFRLKPGDSVEIRVHNLGQVYVKSASDTAVVNWLIT